MKNFDDFVNSLSAEEFTAIYTDAVNSCINDASLETCSSVSDKNSMFSSALIGIVSYKVSIKLLEKYHNWVNEN